jgi:glycerophosphoryl diester phosphodiesterase
MYAFRQAVRAGADMLELDVGVTRDGKVVVLHDTTVNRTTNGRGTVASKTLKQIRRLDAAYWFAPGAPDHYSHDLPRRAYRFRGVATGRTEPPDEETQEYVRNAEVLITYDLSGTLIEVTTPDNVDRAHREGYAWQNWFSGDDRDAPVTWRRLIDMCVDGIMTSRSRALERVLRKHDRPAACG